MRRFVPISTLAILLAVTLAVPTLASATTEENSISPDLLAALKASNVSGTSPREEAPSFSKYE